MASRSQGRAGGPGSDPDAANLGLVRPPLVYLGSILLGVLLHFAWPLPLVRRPLVGWSTGAGVVLMAAALFIAAVRTFRRAGTPVPGNRPTTTIVRTGPYRFSRNPIYLAFSLLQLGIAIWVNGLLLVATLIASVAVMACIVIPREEQYLERRFGTEYLDYKKSVRRWL